MSVSASDADMPGTVVCGALSKPELLDRLGAAGVRLNDYAKILFECELFVISPDASTVSIVETSPARLGLSEGATFPQILAAAALLELRPCPLDLGPCLRLAYLLQSGRDDDVPLAQHRAPPGSLTVVSLPLFEDDEFPKGFYLRSIDGAPWLRGYRCSMDYGWHASDRLVFQAD